MLSAVELVVARATLIVPLPVTSGVMFTFFQVPAVTGPEEPVFVPAGAGALLKVIPPAPLSIQLELATLKTS